MAREEAIMEVLLILDGLGRGRSARIIDRQCPALARKAASRRGPEETIEPRFDATGTRLGSVLWPSVWSKEPHLYATQHTGTINFVIRIECFVTAYVHGHIPARQSYQIKAGIERRQGRQSALDAAVATEGRPSMAGQTGGNSGVLNGRAPDYQKLFIYSYPRGQKPPPF